jgi:hypothetical protein
MLIVNFGQVVDLEAGGMFAHQFTLQLLDGRRVQIHTDERTVQQLLDIVSGTGQAQAHTSQPSVAQVHPQYPSMQYEEIDEADTDEEELAAMSWGDHDPGEQTALGELTSAPEPEPEPVRAGGLGQPRNGRSQPRVDADGFLIPPRAKTVPKDEMGYPIVTQKPKQNTLVSLVASEDDDGTQI